MYSPTSKDIQTEASRLTIAAGSIKFASDTAQPIPEIAHAMASWETLKSRAIMSRDGKDKFNDGNHTAESNARAATTLQLRLVSIPASDNFPARPTPDGWPCLAIMQRKDVGKGVAIKFGEFGERCRSTAERDLVSTEASDLADGNAGTGCR